jgi:hypothetical protein
MQERAFIKSARQYHQAPVALLTLTTTDEPRRYDVALDIWDDPDRAARDLDRQQYRRMH